MKGLACIGGVVLAAAGLIGALASSCRARPERPMHLAFTAFLRLQQAGSLPGLGPTGVVMLAGSDLGQHTGVFHVVRESDPGGVLVFTIAQPDSESRWQLIEAIRRDPTGGATRLTVGGGADARPWVFPAGTNTLVVGRLEQDARPTGSDGVSPGRADLHPTSVHAQAEGTNLDDGAATEDQPKGKRASPKQVDPFVKELIGKAEELRKQGKLDEALLQYRDIEAFFQDYAPEAAVRVGDILLLQGKTDLAIKAYEDAVRKYPNDAARCGAVEKLKRLKTAPN